MRGVCGAVVLAGLALAACGGGDGGTAPGGGGGGGGGATCTSVSIAVTVADNSFTPKCTTVPVGALVTWTWNGTAEDHNVTFSSGTNATNRRNGTFERTFGVAGSFAYSCTNHVGMTGTINVQ